MSRDSSPWRIDGLDALLRTGALRAKVDLRQPSAGLTDLILNGDPLGDVRIFRLLPHDVFDGGQGPTDSYVRGHDLIARYDAGLEAAARPQIYWRVLELRSPAAGVELVVSMQTNRLLSDPTTAVCCDLPPAEVCAFRGGEPPHFQRVELSDSHALRTTSQSESGAFLFRFPRRSYSLLQMVLPAEFREAEFRSESSEKGGLHVCYHLFAQRIEKGVIQRGRVRAVFLPQDEDESLAARLYRQFTADRLPLTT